jgi:galactonate dehydratase
MGSPKGGSEPERLRRLVAEVEAVRKGGGPEFEFALEMWETFSVRSAIDFARAVAPYRPIFIEEPVWREMPHALGEIAAHSPVALAAGEGLVSSYQFKQLLDARGARIVQPDVIHCGGITEIRKIAALAGVYGAEISPHMFYGPIAHAASLHSMAGVRNFLIQEWDAALEPVFTEITRSTFPLAVKGYVTLPSTPGLGIQMDWDLLEKKYPYRGQSLRRPGAR